MGREHINEGIYMDGREHINEGIYMDGREHIRGFGPGSPFYTSTGIPGSKRDYFPKR